MPPFIHFHDYFLKWELQLIGDDDSIVSLGLFDSEEAAQFHADYGLSLTTGEYQAAPYRHPGNGSVTKVNEMRWIAVKPTDPGKRRIELRS